jgi:uncharacterized protein YdhG (YjbR/CyaY superfamily)
MTVIDDHLAGLPAVQRETLLRLRDTLREILPAAEEKISYRMPCVAVQGKAVAGFDGFRDHCSYFPHSGNVIGEVVERYGPVPAWADHDAGTLRFPIDRPLPKALVKRLVRVRLDEISAVTNGKRFEFFDDGSVKAEGSMKNGLLHGSWRWYRKDGSLMRTGSFRLGEKVGEWTTHPSGSRAGS